jgi:hypothetical protein
MRSDFDHNRIGNGGGIHRKHDNRFSNRDNRKAPISM